MPLYTCNADRTHLMVLTGRDASGEPCPTCQMLYPDEYGELIPAELAGVLASTPTDILRTYVNESMLRPVFARYAVGVLVDREHEAEQARQIDELAGILASNPWDVALVSHDHVTLATDATDDAM